MTPFEKAAAIGHQLASADAHAKSWLARDRGELERTITFQMISAYGASLARQAMGIEPREKPPIVASYVCPPIPWRSSDWCAHRDGEEEKGGYGWGATKQEAIDDLLQHEADEEVPC
jgi:hypothetical protein